MFTGIIEQTAAVTELRHQGDSSSGRLGIFVSNLWSDPLELGESISVNGVCLTLASFQDEGLFFDVLQETFDKTMLGQLKAGDIVNVERALQVGARLGGHVVQGHIDETGCIEEIRPQGGDVILTLSCPPSISMYLAYKGSICLNGISLTLASVEGNHCTVHIIPHTWSHTSLQQLHVGDSVNLEVDVLAKYVARQLESGQFPSPPSWDDLGLGTKD